MTADGKASLPGELKLTRMGNEADKAQMKALRNQSDAVIVGSHTVRYDNLALRTPLKNRRESAGLVYPLRVIAVGKILPSPEANIFKPALGGTAIIACGEEMVSPIVDAFPEIIVLNCGAGLKIDPSILTQRLAEEYRTQKILLEGGPSLIGSFLKADLIDRYCVTVCPYLFGGTKENSLTPVSGFCVRELEERRFRLTGVEKSEDWVFLTYERKRQKSFGQHHHHGDSGSSSNTVLPSG